MDHRSPTFEATLLHKTAPTQKLDQIIERTSELLSGYDERITKVEKIDALYYLLSCRRVKILFAFSTDALPLTGMEQAHRPKDSTIRDQQIQSRLLQSNASTTILILERDPELALYTENTANLMRDLCWDIADIVMTHAKADLVFWADTDTLYAAEEFECANNSDDIQTDLVCTINQDEIRTATSKDPHIFGGFPPSGMGQDGIENHQVASSQVQTEHPPETVKGFFNWLKLPQRNNALGVARSHSMGQLTTALLVGFVVIASKVNAPSLFS